MKSSDLNTGYWTDSAFHKQLAQTAALFVPKYLYLLNPTFPVAKEILKALLEQRCQSQGQGSLKDTKQRTTEVQSRVDVGTLFQRATTRLEAKVFQMRMDLKAQAVSLTEEVRKTPWKDGGQSRECLFMATAAAMVRNYTGVSRVTGWKKKCYSTNTYTGKKGILQITMIYDCMGARGVGKLEEREKDYNRDSSSAFLKSVHQEFSQLRQAFPSPSWKDQDWRLASKNKLILSWSPLHRLTNNIPSPIPFINLSNSEGIRKFSQMWLVAADHTYMPILNGFFPTSHNQKLPGPISMFPTSSVSKLTHTSFLPLSVWKVVLRWSVWPQICCKSFHYRATITEIWLLALGEQMAPETTALRHPASQYLYITEQCFVINIETFLWYLRLISGTSSFLP